MYACGGQDNLRELVLAFYHLGIGDCIQVARLTYKCLFPLSCLADSGTTTRERMGMLWLKSRPGS